MNSIDRKSLHPVQLTQWLLASLIMIMVWNAPVRYTAGDSHYSLLTTQAMVEHGSVQLDPYISEVDLIGMNGPRNWQLSTWESTGHTYYYYPPGTPLFSIPFVVVARWLGMDMVFPDHDNNAQIALTSILIVLIFFQLVKLARLYLREWPALLVAFAVVVGSSLVSTLGTALWSQGFQTLFIVTALLEILQKEKGKREHIRPYWLGALLFSAWICRPTSAFFVAMVFVWILIQDRKMLVKCAATAGSLMVLFMLWSYSEYQTFLPKYFNPGSWESLGYRFFPTWTAIWFGPARGVFLFTPIFIAIFAGWAFAPLRRKPLQYLIWGWLIIHTWMIVRSPSPWGGWCYGPRFYTELVPGLVVLLLELYSVLKPQWRRFGVGLFVVFAGWGIFVHSYQGLYNTETILWNGSPAIDYNWGEVRWDGNYPQFFASAVSNARKQEEWTQKTQIESLNWQIPDGDAVLHGPNNANMRSFCMHWNADGGLHGHPVFNSLYAMETAGFTAGWATQAGWQMIAESGNYEAEIIYGKSLGEWLEANRGSMILLSAKDDASTALSPASKDWLRTAGAQIDSLKYRESYIAIIQAGKIVAEKKGFEKLIWEQVRTMQDPGITVVSAGKEFGNESLMEVNGQYYGFNARGINAVAMDVNGTVRAIANFDTHTRDAETPHFIRIYRK